MMVMLEKHLRRFVVAGTLLAPALALTACAPTDDEAANTVAEEQSAPNTLTAAEQEEGWQLLFDGRSFDGWKGLGRNDIPLDHWEVVDGTIHKKAKANVPVQADGQPSAGGDLMTAGTYRDFELLFDWKVAPGGNSGIKYNVSESLSVANPPATAALGFEYQVLDDEKHADANAGNGTNRRAAGLYDLMGPADDKPINPAGEWNQGRIVFQGNHGEHWLNGRKVLEYDLDSPQFDSLFQASKYSGVAEFPVKKDGHIVLQDHNDDAWYRNVKIRPLTPQ